MIRVVIVDDHPVVRAGVWSMLRVEPGLQPAGAAADAAEGLQRVTAVRPDVVLVDYRLGHGNGLLLCQSLHELATPPRVLVYSAYDETELAVPALIAGASGVLSKDARPMRSWRPSAVSPGVGVCSRRSIPERVHAAAVG